MKSVNPATEEIIREYPEPGPGEVETCLERAEAAFGDWRRSSFDRRADLLKQAAGLLRLDIGEHTRPGVLLQPCDLLQRVQHTQRTERGLAIRASKHA